MNSGVYVIQLGSSTTCRFETMTSARMAAGTYDTIIDVGDDGKELGRWTKARNGTLVLIPKADHPWRERRRYRDLRGPPPPGGRGPDGKPFKFNPFAVGTPGAGNHTTPESPQQTIEPGDATGLGPPGADRIPKEP